MPRVHEYGTNNRRQEAFTTKEPVSSLEGTDATRLRKEQLFQQAVCGYDGNSACLCSYGQGGR